MGRVLNLLPAHARKIDISQVHSKSRKSTHCVDLNKIAVCNDEILRNKDGKISNILRFGSRVGWSRGCKQRRV